ncbi:MAG: outer membrane protein assembly factor BamD [Acidobacteria bacterium]|nr:outer membrane protein assembly factor BamD [Acidobacteriota bacterium]MBI3663707.1 outer membrane protein assembly factor BamD [Acidobacteriota bacterium]
MTLNAPYKLRPLAAVLLACLLLSGCFGKGKTKKTAPDFSQSAEPDKILYEQAMADLKKGRHEIGRITLQTLINTYPDSEYLAKAKLATADSFYDEGTSSSLTQAVAEYKDFRTFFEFLDEAAYAQYRIGMAHFRRMEKPDRDRTHAKMAEQEFQEFLLRYPENKLNPEAEQRLREVQEVLAEGDFRIARFYFLKDTDNARRAAVLRLSEIVDRYPLYSQADRALWMLAEALARSEKTQHLAPRYYSRIVQDYPLSSYVSDAKQRLVKMNVPVPQPSPDALARLQKEKEMGREKASLARSVLGMFKTGPDVTSAARAGKPNMTPPSEAMGGESLVAGGNLSVSGSKATGGAATPGGPVSTVSTAPGAASPSTSQPSAAQPQPPAPESVKPAGTSEKSTKDAEKAKKEKEKKESSSKKKKGIRKILPW